MMNAYLCLAGLPKPIRISILVKLDPIYCFYLACISNKPYIADLALDLLLPASKNSTLRSIANASSFNIEIGLKIGRLPEMKKYAHLIFNRACLHGKVDKVLAFAIFREKNIGIQNLVMYGHLGALEALVDINRAFAENYLTMAILFRQLHIVKRFGIETPHKTHKILATNDESLILNVIYEKTPPSFVESIVIIMWAAINNEPKIMTAAINAGTYSGKFFSAAEIAASLGHVEILKILKSEVNDIPDKILFKATKYGRLPVLEYLLEIGIKFSPATVVKAKTKAISNCHFHLLDALAYFEN